MDLVIMQMSQFSKRFIVGPLVICLIGLNGAVAAEPCIPSPIPGQPIEEDGSTGCSSTTWQALAMEQHIDPWTDTIHYVNGSNPLNAPELLEVAYQDNRTGAVYDLKVNLTASNARLIDASGATVAQRPLLPEEVVAIRNGGQTAENIAPAVEAVLIAIAGGLILLVATDWLTDSREQRDERRKGAMEMGRNANDMANAAQQCARSGRKYHMTSAPSFELCGGGTGYCSPN